MKLLICPGVIHSRNDGDRHFITESQLANLYKIDFRKHEVRILKPNETLDKYAGFIILSPLYDGEYSKLIEELGLR